MNIEGLSKKLLAVARANPPDDRVPYAFEKRILARISRLPKPDQWADWAVAMWRGAATCVLAMILMGAISFLHGRNTPASRVASDEFSPQFEKTMLAAVDQSREAW